MLANHLDKINAGIPTLLLALLAETAVDARTENAIAAARLPDGVTRGEALCFVESLLLNRPTISPKEALALALTTYEMFGLKILSAEDSAVPPKKSVQDACIFAAIEWLRDIVEGDAPPPAPETSPEP